MEGYTTFNINNTIKVKLEDIGYELLAEEHNSYAGAIPKWEVRTAEYYKNKADSFGYSEFQAWYFMQIFGPVTALGGPGYYHTTILIQTKDLENESA